MENILETDRLRLRPFCLNDVSFVNKNMGDKDIAATSCHIPHPYNEEMARNWIQYHRVECEKGNQAVFAAEVKKSRGLVAAIGLTIKKEHQHGELGYWVAKPFLRQGYCVEACRRVIEFAFTELALNRVYAQHFKSNHISGKVLRALGMQHEGCMMRHINKWGKFEDLEIYGILKVEWLCL